jgi:AraC-like DNA-binding protein
MQISVTNSMAPSLATGVRNSTEGVIRFFRQPERNLPHREAKPIMTHFNDDEIRTRLEDHFDRNMPFLRQRYLLNDLVEEIGIPRHVLSAFIKRAYGLSFPNLLNRYRIGFLMGNRHKPEWRSYKMEAIGLECGFNSRNSFIKGVKKFLGQVPSKVLNGNTSAELGLHGRT